MVVMMVMMVRLCGCCLCCCADVYMVSLHVNAMGQTYQRALRVDALFIPARVSYCYLLLVQQNEPGAEVSEPDSQPVSQLAVSQLVSQSVSRSPS
jgi:hypothetical protein